MNTKGNLRVYMITSEIPTTLEHEINNWLIRNQVNIKTIIHEISTNTINDTNIYLCYIYYYENN